MASRIKAEDFQEKVQEKDKLVVIDFYSDSCLACRRFSPILGAVEEELEEKAVFYKINSSYEEELTRQLEIMAQPTLLLYRDGKELERKSGVLTKNAFLEWLKPYLDE